MQRSTVATVDSYEADDRGVTLHCKTDQSFVGTDFKYREETQRTGDVPVNRRLPISLTFYNPSTFRFEFVANPEAGATESLTDLDASAITTDVEVEVTEEDDALVVESSDLRVIIGLTEWTFGVERQDGAVVLEEQRADVDVHGDRRIEPLGFAEEIKNNGPRRVERIGTTFALGPDEHFYGFGEKFTNFDKRGQKLTSWTVEPLGTETEKSYKNVPFHLSSHGFGFLVDTTARVEYDLGATSSASATIDVADDTFSFVFFDGPSFADIIEEYTAFSGRSPRPPKWSFGVWMSRLGYESRDHLEDIATRLRDENIPCDVIHLDPFWMREFRSTDLQWDTEQFPDPEGMIDWLDEHEFHLSLWEHPYVPVGSDAFTTGVESEYFVEDSTGKPYVMDDLCQGDYAGAIVDFTDPDAVDWWQGKHRRLLEMGVDVFKTDYGEAIPEDAVFDNGLTGKTVHNYYPFLYNRTVYEAVKDVNGEKDALVWGRSAWTGSQRFPMYWGGDAQTSFHGMASALRGGLGMSMSGFPFWSHDIGGFRGTPDDEVYIRWVQFGLLSSHARCHGTTPREPWAFGEEAVRIFKKYAELRYQLLPYLYTVAEEATRTGLPVVRPLVLEYQDDPRTYDIELQYLLGDSLLVAPVFETSGRVSVYLPEGDDWIDYWSGEYHVGGQTLHLETDLDEMPVFIRANSVIPMGEATQTVQEGTPESVTLRITPDCHGSVATETEFYDEDANALVNIEVTLDEESLDLHVGDDGRSDLFVAEVTDIELPPKTVTLDGDRVERVDGTPTPGSWSYDESRETLTVDLA